MAQKQIIIICGEASGDLHAANLAKNILSLDPQIKISAVGGELLAQAGAEIFCDIKGLAVMGFFDVLKKLPKFLALKKIVLEKIKSLKPDAVIFVDFSGFNLRLAKTLDNRLPAIYYISPQVWASRPGRVETVKKYIRKMIVIFKFEEKFYREYGVNVDFTGHPLLDTVRPQTAKADFLRKNNLSEKKTTIALLPGSRKSEIKNVLPVMLEAAKLINQEIPDTQFLIAQAPGVSLCERGLSPKALLPGGQKGVPELNLKIIDNQTYDCLNAADFALVCSGTATLETAIMQKPFLVVYKMGLLNYLLYRPQVRLPYIGMVNIVAGKKIVPEFVQFEARPREIAQAALKILKSPAESQQLKANLAAVKSSLGSPGASLRAAKIIVDFLNEH